MEIDVGGKKKRLVATNCTIKSPLSSRLGFGKKREVLACQSVDIIDPEEESRPFEPGEELAIQREDDEDQPINPESFDALEARSKALPKQPREMPKNTKDLPEP